MKKFFAIVALMSMGLIMLTSCSSDSDDGGSVPQQMKNYLKVENATYAEGTIPQATTTEKPKVQVAPTVQQGRKAIIRVAKDRVYTKFFIGLKGVPGYWVYTPENTRAESNDGDYYDIPFEGGDNATGSATIQICGQTEDGAITQPYEQTINYTEKPTIKLLNISANGRAYMTFTYNAQGKVTSFYLYGDGTKTLAYDGNSITSMVDQEEGINYTVSQNEQGYITRMQGHSEDYTDNLSFTYNEQGRLTLCDITGSDDGDPFSASHKLTWENGKLVKSEHSSTDEKSKVVTYTYTYGEYVNEFQQPFAYNTDADAFPSGINLFGKGSTMLPVKAVSNGTTIDYSYTFNADGSIKTQKLTRNDGKTVELSYTY